jgi:hypothetical protein
MANSQSNQSEKAEKKDTAPKQNPQTANLEKSYPEKVAANIPDTTPEEAAAAKEKQDKELDKQSEKAAKGGKSKDVDSYDPYLDPVVPSSTLADTINTELQSGEGSPTLQALRDAKKDADKKNEDDGK